MKRFFTTRCLPIVVVALLTHSDSMGVFGVEVTDEDTHETTLTMNEDAKDVPGIKEDPNLEDLTDDDNIDDPDTVTLSKLVDNDQAEILADVDDADDEDEKD